MQVQDLDDGSPLGLSSGKLSGEADKAKGDVAYPRPNHRKTVI